MNRDELILKLVKHVATPKMFDMHADKYGYVDFASTGWVSVIGDIARPTGLSIRISRQEFLAKRDELSRPPENIELPSEAEYVAQDITGSWVSFTEKPVFTEEGWAGAGKSILCEGHLVYGIDLSDTLQKL